MEKASGETLVPLCEEDVTVDWMSKVLGCNLNPNTFKITRNAHDGKGFLSNLIRISCENEETSEKIDVLVKLGSEDEKMRSLSITLNSVEILTYQKVIPRIIQAMPSMADYICPFFYGKFEGSGESQRSVLVMKDLKPMGYATVDFGENITKSQLGEGIDFLAKLHFAGSLIEKEEGKRLDEIYDFLVVGDLQELAISSQDLLRQNYQSVLQYLSNSSAAVQNDYGELNLYLEDVMVDVFIKTAEFPALIHGDLWTNNILFNSDSSLHTKIIDWQLLAYRDSVLDLAVFIISSLPTDKITNENVQKYLKQYYDAYHELCTEKDVILECRGWEIYSKFFETYGIAYALLWFILSFSAIKGKNDERLLRIFEYFQEVGVVKFAISIKRNN